MHAGYMYMYCTFKLKMNTLLLNLTCIFILMVVLNILQISSKDTFDTLSALDIAEQLTYLDHQIFMNIQSE